MSETRCAVQRRRRRRLRANGPSPCARVVKFEEKNFIFFFFFKVSCTQHTVNINTTTDKYLGMHTGFYGSTFNTGILILSNRWLSASSVRGRGHFQQIKWQLTTTQVCFCTLTLFTLVRADSILMWPSFCFVFSGKSK